MPWIGVALITLCFRAAGVGAQELAPRAYWPAPNGTKVVVFAYQYSSGDVVMDPSLPITGVDLLAADLVDEIRTFTFPVVLGKGKRLFDPSSRPRTFKLTHRAVSPNGLIAATYVRDGEVKTAIIGGAQEPTPVELARREKLARGG